MLLDGLYVLLSDDERLSGMLRGGIHKTMYPEGSCLPVLTFQGAGGSRQPTFETSGMQKARIQFDVHGEYPGQAHAVLDALRLLLDGFYGQLGEGTRVALAELINPVPIDFPVEQYARDFRAMSEYYIHFTFQS